MPFNIFSEEIIGAGELNENGKGIKRGTSPCSCDYLGKCTCFRPHTSRPQPKPSSGRMPSASFSVDSGDLRNDNANISITDGRPEGRVMKML